MPADVAAAAAAAAAARPGKNDQLDDADVARAVDLLRGGVMFRRCAGGDLQGLARAMFVRRFAQGDDLVTQGDQSRAFWMLASGEALRLRRDPKTGTVHHVDAAACGSTINSLPLLAADPVFATARCVSDECCAFGIGRDAFIAHLAAHPGLSRGIIEGLSRDARRRSKLYRTPLLQQSNANINYSAVAIAAVTESYYRSALNSLLNARLTGIASPLFPNMHVQVPARVAYITGFKGLRALLDRRVSPEAHAHPNAVRLATMVGPGVLMTPVSSALEACNAGHVNPEPLARRSLRGTVPRCAREVIFGIGINQMSDFFEERFRTTPALQFSSNPLVSNLAGSVTAGVLAGYFSHVPHNLSTYKLLEPAQSYRALFNKFVDKSVPEHLVPRGVPDAALPAMRAALACLFPRGVVIRTTQIVGSFVILNGTIQWLQSVDQKRFGHAVAAMDDGDI